MDFGPVVTQIDTALVEARREVEQLEAARSALAGLGNSATPASTPGPASPPATTRRRGRPRGGGTRHDQAIKLVQRTPGISIPDLAKAMGIEPNYLYRVMPKLLNEGRVRKEGQGWHPTEAVA